MKCSICTGGGLGKDIPYACGHHMWLCAKCSANIYMTGDCAECQHSMFDVIEKEINEATEQERQKKQLEEEAKPKTTVVVKDTSTTTTSSSALSYDKPIYGPHKSGTMARWAHEKNPMSRCDGCQFYFCDCEKSSTRI